MKQTALYPGSFDPVTRGHEDIIARANEQFDVRVGVAVNPGKSPAFTLQERVRLLQTAVGKEGIDPLSVVRIPGSTARWMKRNGIYKMVRGQRDALDELAEAQLEHFNTLEYPEIKTVLFGADEELKYASSSAAKMLMKANHNPSSVVSLDVQEALTSRLLSQYPVYIAGGMGAGKSTISRSLEEQARNVGIGVKYIELDQVGLDIYTTLNEPYYQGVRQKLRATFGSDISPDGNWVDKMILREKLKDASGHIQTEQLQKLDAIMIEAIEFRYRDMIEGFQGIILIDGIIKEGFSFSRLAHNNILFVDTNESVRIDRLMRRYERKGDSVGREYIASMIQSQPSREQVSSMVQSQIDEESHGSLELVDGTDAYDTRKTFFQLLNQIDRYGELRATWILSKLGIQGNMREHLNFLQSKYNESHRYYHTWEHIVESLTILFQMAIDLDLSDEEIMKIGGALLGHDLEYAVDPKRYRTNESNSARIWIRYLEKYGVNMNHLEDIEDLIKETRHGRVHVPERLISRVMHDVDMAILGSSWERYRIYGGDVRSEFAPVMSGLAFETARREKFLEPVLAQDGKIYKTEWAADRLTTNLIANIRREIAGLS
ncbi:MAG: dephospho-CoA kinase [Candidatus Gracilibacteria bacterium]|nr:dephospho-CoA kinase [Candidatus Gracilibacteria bacterium]